jgi:hypothetical protein
MARKPIKDDKKPPAPKAKDQSHKPAKHIEETARLASSVETAKDPGKVRNTKDWAHAATLIESQIAGDESELRRPDKLGK